MLTRTHHWRDWSLEDLVAMKRRGDHRVSLVVPARDEEATVGDVVGRVRSALVDTVALVDEVVVIDSDSTDATAVVASEAGATVHRAADIRPDVGPARGKGEALWKSLFVTTGDLLVFMDADLVDWDTHFVPGLLGPLLDDPRTLLVKGCYARPSAAGSGPEGYEGGRVTELVARPAIALLFPALAGVAQPLAGEWAVRRDHFAGLSVPRGYGVELAALIDTLTTAGAEAVAQVELGRRAHRNQPLLDLGLMATQVLAAAHRRAGLPVPDSLELAQYPVVDGDHGPTRRLHPVDVAERPPARDLVGGARTP